MKLTDEERRIADDVALHWAYTLHKLDDAWARALAHIAARRKALDEAEPPGTATAAGVAAPTAEAARWSSLVEKVEQVADDICGVGSGVTVDGTPHEWLDAIAREYHRLRIEEARRDKPGTATAAGVGGDMKADDQLQPGDYVLATKWGDGDPGDHFVVGYLANPPKLGRNSDRWMVVNDEGIPFRATGFRRAEKITPDEGQAILAIMPQIANVEGPSLWEHLARIRGEAKGGGREC